MLSGKRKALYDLVAQGMAPMDAVCQVYPLASSPQNVWESALQEEEFIPFRSLSLPQEGHPALLPGSTKDAVVDRLWSIAMDPNAPASAQVAAAKELSNLKGYTVAATENFRPTIVISLPQGYAMPVADYAFKDVVTIDAELVKPIPELGDGDSTGAEKNV